MNIYLFYNGVAKTKAIAHDSGKHEQQLSSVGYFLVTYPTRRQTPPDRVPFLSCSHSIYWVPGS